jgi:hypothetical protein
MPPRFDPAQSLESTPPFVRWTLALACPIRELDDSFDPDCTERLLRGVRCFSDAVAVGRVREGIVLQQDSPLPGRMLGFEASAVLEPFGGEAIVSATCSACPANALRVAEPTALAGCVGHLVPPADASFHERMDAIAKDPAHPFPTTAPAWHGLWINQRPSREDLEAQRELLGRLGDQDFHVVGLADYLLAISAALEHRIPLIIRAYPGGRCEGRRWYVEPHCNRCNAAWPEAKRQQCLVCSAVGGRQPERRRKRMGTRPYRLLADFLDADQIARILP